MGSGTWLQVDEILGLAEFFLVPLSIFFLLIATFAGSRTFAFCSAALAVLLAITIAQPFGIESVPMTASEFAAGHPKPADAEDIHTIGPLGLPLFGFRPYARNDWYINGEAGDPDADLRVRSWLFPAFLVNGSRVTGLFYSADENTWEEKLRLVRAGDQWRYAIRTGAGGEEESYFRLRVGITSIAGVAYWIVAGLLILALILLGDRPLGRRWSESLGRLDA